VPSGERVAKNESIFREVNERIGEVADRFAIQEAEAVGFICECSREQCVERLLLARHEYAAARRSGKRFVLVPGHEDLRHENVISTTERYILVEKHGEAGAKAALFDRRRGAS
jgi:hypothetical protein